MALAARLVVSLAFLLGLLLGVTPSAARAQSDSAPQAISVPAPEPLPELEGFSARAAAAPRSSPTHDAARRGFITNAAATATAYAAGLAAEAELVRLEGRAADTAARIAAAEGRSAILEKAIESRRADVVALAIERYTGATDPLTAGAEQLAHPEAHIAQTDEAYADELVFHAGEALGADLARLRTRRLLLGREIAAMERTERSIDRSIEIELEALVAARAEAAAAREALERHRKVYLDSGWSATVVGTGLDLVVVDAYMQAAEAAPCSIRWETLAGIGYIETRHGTWAGSSIGRDGRTTKRIIGIALDGNNNTMEILDSEGGELDGDPVYDRAVGPMQFIPTTWAIYRIDADQSGFADPHDLADAAAAAANYLCASGGDNAAAIFAYNHSFEYVADVQEHASRYEAAGV